MRKRMEDYPTSLLRTLVREMPQYKCEDFHHSSRDQHGMGGICGPLNRFKSAHQQSEAYLACLTEPTE